MRFTAGATELNNNMSVANSRRNPGMNFVLVVAIQLSVKRSVLMLIFNFRRRRARCANRFALRGGAGADRRLIALASA